MRRERGAAAVELTLFTPLLIIMALVLVLAFRVTSAQSSADEAAHAAARAATLQRSPQAAQAAAEQEAARALRTHGLPCERHDLNVATHGLDPGSAVTASLTCHARLSDLWGLGVPGTYAAEGNSTAVVDRYRGTP